MKLEAYWQAITVIEAQDILIQLRISDYPGMKKEDRKRTHREFHRLAYPKTESDSTEVLTTEELAERLKAAL